MKFRCFLFQLFNFIMSRTGVRVVIGRQICAHLGCTKQERRRVNKRKSARVGCERHFLERVRYMSLFGIYDQGINIIFAEK